MDLEPDVTESGLLVCLKEPSIELDNCSSSGSRNGPSSCTESRALPFRRTSRYSGRSERLLDNLLRAVEDGRLLF